MNAKIVRTYYDYENIMELKDKVSELLPTFKPLQPRKRDRIQILQLQEEYQGELEQLLGTSPAKKHRRDSSKAKINKEI